MIETYSYRDGKYMYYDTFLFNLLDITTEILQKNLLM